MYDKHLIIVCDRETGEWSIVHQSSDVVAAQVEADKIRETDSSTPLVLINTANFINF